MLQFVLGRAGSGKTDYLRRLLADRSRTGFGGTVMIVPEQYTFETEKAMLRLAGPVRGNSIPVYSFTRLAEAVFRKEGGAVGRRLSDGGRRILMASAVEARQDRLEVYAATAKSGRITDVMLTAVNEMKMCGISPGELLQASQDLGDRGLGKKLQELSLLYDTYEALVAASYLDTRDDLTRLAQALETSDFFAGCTVAVDSFEGFTAQELKVLTQILRSADQVVVALCTDGLDDTGTGLFALVDRTRRRLTAVAQENGVRVQPPVMLTGAPRFQNENLKLVEAQLFCAGEIMTSQDYEGVTLFEARDPYEEAEFVAATIRKLVMEEGYRYREISIICRDPQRYYGCLDAALKKRDIPCFVSQPAKVDGEPVTRFVLGAFQAVLMGYQTEALLEMLKTGVSGFTTEEISDLENYAYLWKISGSAWRQEFVRHPQGFGKELTEEDRLELARLNSLRERLIGPLERFESRTRNATGAELSQAVYLLLMAYGMEENLPQYCLALEEAGEDALSQKQLRIWDLLMETLDQMRAILGDKPIPRERYCQLLKEVIAGEDVSEIPQTLDQVLFGTAEQVRQSAPRAAFLIGVAQGEFPLAPKSNGVFSDAERRELIARDLPLGDPLEQRTMEERYLAYSVACAPSQRLYMTWPRSADGEDKEPSELVSALLGIFPNLRPLRDLPDEYFADSKEAAFSRMAARFRETDAASGAFRMLFQEEPDYQGRVESLERASGAREQRVTDPALTKGLFGEHPFLSPTQVETFYQCRFQYFCKYGLGARERRTAEVDVLQLGHTHTTYINSAPIPVGEAKNNAGEVVRYDLTLNADKEITSATVETVSMEGIEPDQGLRELPAVKSAQEKTVSFIQDNVLGHASADFQPVDEIKGIPSGRIEDTAVIDLIGTVQLENSGADVTAVALFKDTSDLKKGDLNYGNLFDIYKYPNVLYTVKVSGAEMKAYMEWAAACWNQWKEGDVSISFNPQKPGYLHDHFIGLNYEVNLSKPAGERIENVTFQGKPLTDDMTLTLCVNDYRYTGLKNEGIISGEKEWESSASVRDMLVAYLAEHDPLEPAVDHNWKITGVDLQKDNPDRATLIELVNTGRLESPYSQSLNLDTYSEVLGMVDNVKVSDLDKTGTAASFVGADGAPYFRMRDLAYTFNGSKNQFNVSWADGNVAITTSTAYDGELFPLPVRIPAAVQEQIPADITVSVDGTDITVPAILFDGHYYLTVDGMNALLGTNATIQEKAA